MTAYIEHEAAPAKTRRVADRHRGQHAGTVLVGGQLQDRLEPMHRTRVSCCRQRGSLRSDAQQITLILVDRLHRLTRPGYVDVERWIRGSGMIDCGSQHISTASTVQLHERSFHSGFEARVVWLAVAISERRTSAPGRSDCECTIATSKRAGERHQREPRRGSQRCLGGCRQCGNYQGNSSDKQRNRQRQMRLRFYYLHSFALLRSPNRLVVLSCGSLRHRRKTYESKMPAYTNLPR